MYLKKLVEKILKDKLFIPILILIVVVGVAFIFHFLSNQSLKDYDFEIHFFSCGKADAILLRKDNYTILIDTGEEDFGEEILSYLKEHSITKIDTLILTHFDKDHIGSASVIIDSIEIGEVLQSNSPKESVYYTNYLNSLEAKNITPVTVSGDYDISIDGLSIIVNGPEGYYSKNESNNSSLIVSVVHQNNKFLFMGDAENDRLQDYLSSHWDTYDFIKVPYHGNYLKKFKKLLDDNQIKYAVITSSDEELEDEKTIELLKEYSIQTYLTRKGDIHVYSNGKKIIIK